MTIDEAIKRLNRVVGVDPDAWEKPDDEALKLGIEALKCVRDWRACNYPFSETELPSEEPLTYHTDSEAYLRLLKESPLGKKPKG